MTATFQAPGATRFELQRRADELFAASGTSPTTLPSRDQTKRTSAGGVVAFTRAQAKTFSVPAGKVVASPTSSRFSTEVPTITFSTVTSPADCACAVVVAVNDSEGVSHHPVTAASTANPIQTV